jgi:ribulose-5-phosphate 4-epimerase/fuculose-1-phosphate aldolase
MNENQAREHITLYGQSLYDRGFTFGSSGNISYRLDDGWLLTPTNSCMGRLDPGKISKLDDGGNLLAGDPPSKEAFLHASVYAERPKDKAIIHLHSTHSVAVSCLPDVDPENVLPPITAYYVMRIGKLPLVPYFAPGDKSLADAVAKLAGKHSAVLLANHGPVVAGTSLESALYAMEELEETAKLHLLLQGHHPRVLNQDQIDALQKRFPNT